MKDSTSSASSGYRLNGWILGFSLVLFLVLLPIGYIALSLLTPSSQGWDHIVEHLLGTYVENSLILLVGVSAVVLLLGVPTAWLTTAYRFPASKHFDWLLMTPLAIPTYIIATVYAQMCSYTGVFQHWYGYFTDGSPLPFEMLSMGGAVCMMGLVLYPYTYIMTRASFKQQSATLLEAARLMGDSTLRAFWKIGLPLARPAIAGSIFLVMMEVLNEYGTVKYYGVATFTTGIFRAWLSMGDASAATRLSACLLLFILALIFLERWQRGKGQYASAPKSQKPLSKKPLTGLWGWLAFAYCCIPVLLGLAIPLAQLIYWAWETKGEALTDEFGTWIFNTLTVGGVAALFTVMAALIMTYTARLSPTRSMRSLSKLSTLGYAIPGAVTAVGIMAIFIRADKAINWGLREMGGSGVGLLLSGTITALTAAYLIRFLAIAYNPIEAGFEKTTQRLDEASRSLGYGPMATLWNINLPLLRTTLLSAMLMVGIEVMKELPLTLILRPFNFDTLATKAYELASDEQIQASSSAALLIIIAGMIPVISLIRVLDRRS